MILSGALLLALTVASIEPPAEGLAHWWQRMHQELDSLAEQRRVVPPVPRKVRWRPSRIWSGQLDGELVDMVTGDMDSDGTSEIYALTTEKLVVLSRARGLFDVRAQVDLPAAPASIRSREPIGSMRVGETNGVPTLRARTSEQSLGAAYQLVDGVVAPVSEFSGYPLCRASTIEAAPGRNYFLGASASWQGHEGQGMADLVLGSELYAARCSRGTVDPSGHRLLILSEVSTAGRVRLRCLGAEEHCQAVPRELDGVGYAHLVADIDNDGAPELLTSSASLPGQPDQISVRSLQVGGERTLFDDKFAGGIVAIAAGDFEGDDSLGVVVAVRQNDRISLWLLN